MKIKILESDIQKSVEEFLISKYLINLQKFNKKDKRLGIYKMMVDPDLHGVFYHPEEKQYVGTSGLPDIIGFVKPKDINNNILGFAFELKTHKNRPTEAQERMLSILEIAGFYVGWFNDKDYHAGKIESFISKILQEAGYED